jgi:hypothetical protein
LLTPQQVLLLKNEALANMPEKLLKDAINKLPKEVKMVFEAELNLRNAFERQTNLSFAELERFAIVPGESPKSDIPAGTWTYRRGGSFLRAKTHSYKETDLELYIPQKYNVERDALRRIVKVSNNAGWSVETTYQDGPAMTSPEAPGLSGYQFKSIRYTLPNKKIYTVANKGWVAYGVPTNKPQPAPNCVTPRRLAQNGYPDVQAWRNRYERGRETYSTLDNIRRWLGFETERERQQAAEDALDIDHYREGLETVGGTPEDRLEFIAETHHGLIDALIGATRDIESLPDGSSEYDPSDGVLIPGSSGAQRIGTSGRSFGH